MALCALLWILAPPVPSLAQTPVAAPTIDSVASLDGSLTIEWTAPAGVTGITAYDLRHIGTSADETVDGNWSEIEDVWTTGSGDLKYVLGGLTNGTGYDVQMRTVTSTNGTWSGTSVGTPTDYGNTTSTATTLTLGSPLAGTIDPGTDEDYFELVLGSAQTILVWTSGDLDTVGELQDSDGTELESNDYGGLPEGPHNFVIWRAVQDGTYYLKVSSGDEVTGAYVLHAIAIQDSTSTSNAVTVSPDSATPALAEKTLDYDYFRLTLAAETDLIIRTTGSVNVTSIAILDSRQTQIATNNYGLLPPRRHPRPDSTEPGGGDLFRQGPRAAYRSPGAVHPPHQDGPGARRRDHGRHSAGAPPGGRGKHRPNERRRLLPHQYRGYDAHPPPSRQ